MKTKTFRLIGNTWVKSISQIKFVHLQQLHSIMGNVRQSCSKMGYIKKLP